MALFTPGRTKCVICGRVVEAHDENQPTPEYLPGPLGRFRDAIVHQACFDTWEHREEVLRLIRDRPSPYLHRDDLKDPRPTRGAGKAICTIERLQRHMKDSGGLSLRIGKYVLRLEEDDKPIATVALFISVDKDGNIFVDHNFASEGNRIRVSAD